MKKIILVLLLTLCPLFVSKPAYALEFQPSLDLGLGLQVYDNDNGNNDTYFYGTLKSYMFRQPNPALGIKLLGIGYGLNTNGDSQVILSPISLSILNIITVAPDYGVGLGDAPNYWGLSIGLGF